MFNYNQQLTADRIDGQIAQLQQMKAQITQPHTPSINQTFQLAPTNQNMMRYAASIDDVNKEMVMGDTPFFSKDMSVLWIKNNKGEIKSYELNEIVHKDEKDLMIESLQYQIQELRKEMRENAKSNVNDVDESTESKKSTNVSSDKSS